MRKLGSAGTAASLGFSTITAVAKGCQLGRLNNPQRTRAAMPTQAAVQAYYGQELSCTADLKT
ncbi:MAG: hypothetical protein WD136_09035, partial [Cyanobium sp.]